MANSKTIFKTTESRQKIMAKTIERFFFPLAFLLLAASVAAIYLIFGKTYQSFRSGQDSLKAKEAELAVDDARQRLAVMQKHVTELESIPEEERERMAIVLPAGSNQLETLIQLESFAKNVDLFVSDFHFTEGSQVGEKGKSENGEKDSDTALISSKTISDKVTLSFKVSNYESLKKIMAAIQSNLRLLDIDSLAFSVSGDVSISMTTHHLP